MPDITTFPITITGDIQFGFTGPGVAAGGTTGQSLKKASATDYDTEWADLVSADITDATSDGNTNKGKVLKTDANGDLITRDLYANGGGLTAGSATQSGGINLWANGNKASLTPVDLTAQRFVSIQDASGTLAFTEDIAAHVADVNPHSITPALIGASDSSAIEHIIVEGSGALDYTSTPDFILNNTGGLVVVHGIKENHQGVGTKPALQVIKSSDGTTWEDVVTLQDAGDFSIVDANLVKVGFNEGYLSYTKRAWTAVGGENSNIATSHYRKTTDDFATFGSELTFPSDGNSCVQVTGDMVRVGRVGGGTTGSIIYCVGAFRGTAIGSARVGVFRTVDSTATWTFVEMPNQTLATSVYKWNECQVLQGYDGSLYVMARSENTTDPLQELYNNRIWRSLDDGDTWHDWSSGQITLDGYTSYRHRPQGIILRNGLWVVPIRYANSLPSGYSENVENVPDAQQPRAASVSLGGLIISADNGKTWSRWWPKTMDHLGAMVHSKILRWKDKYVWIRGHDIVSGETAKIHMTVLPIEDQPALAANRGVAVGSVGAITAGGSILRTLPTISSAISFIDRPESTTVASAIDDQGNTYTKSGTITGSTKATGQNWQRVYQFGASGRFTAPSNTLLSKLHQEEEWTVATSLKTTAAVVRFDILRTFGAGINGVLLAFNRDLATTKLLQAEIYNTSGSQLACVWPNGYWADDVWHSVVITNSPNAGSRATATPGKLRIFVDGAIVCHLHYVSTTFSASATSGQAGTIGYNGSSAVAGAEIGKLLVLNRAVSALEAKDLDAAIKH